MGFLILVGLHFLLQIQESLPDLVYCYCCLDYPPVLSYCLSYWSPSSPTSWIHLCVLCHTSTPFVDKHTLTWLY